MKLIDKDALVAEIEKLKAYLQIPNAQLDAVKVCDNIVSIIDTLEVKEVDLDNMLTAFMAWYAYENGGEYPSAIDIAKHFFELGFNAHKGK